MNPSRTNEFYRMIDSAVARNSRAGVVAKLLYAAQPSDQMVVPGCTCARIMGRRVAASLWSTSSIYPRAGVTLVSHILNTHASLSAGRPLLY